VYFNVNIRVLVSKEIIEYAAMSDVKSRGENLMLQAFMSSQQHSLNILPTLAVDSAVHLMPPKCEISGDEKHMQEVLIR
jgi:hypothetical protein